jgi:ABC-type multidrug transport system fused ATPase/permease subunit
MITADGIVTSQNKETLTFQTAGRVIYLPFKEGDKIYKGQTIAQLDLAKLQANQRQAEQDFTAAKAVSEKLYNDQGTKTDESYDEKIKRTAIDAAQNKAYDAVVKARQDVSDATLRASVKGVLMHADVTETGVNVTPATSFVIADPDAMIFKANIPMGSIYYISEGATVSLLIDGNPNKMTGVVNKIYPSKVLLPNGQYVYQADIVSDDLKKSAKLDQSGRAIISTNAKNVALVNISFEACPGEVTAIIGGTGSGKTTMVNLIPRFYDVENGEVLIDGVDTREMSQDELRAKIGFVPQKAILFSGTINENLRYGKEDATESEIKHAADVAQATDFILRMPEKFESRIAQGGTNVSGGQMQRLSIARALVRKPEIYVFDDTFSALDFKTDANLRAALKGEIKQSTVIIVAQRVSTVIDADQIIVLDDGKIAGIGKHNALMKSCAIYKGIVTSQLSAAEIEEEAS